MLRFESADERDYFVDRDPAHLRLLADMAPLLDSLAVLEYNEGVWT